MCTTEDGAAFRNVLITRTLVLPGNLKQFGLGPIPTTF